jgi:hypothetical protein
MVENPGQPEYSLIVFDLWAVRMLHDTAERKQQPCVYYTIARVSEDTAGTPTFDRKNSPNDSRKSFVAHRFPWMSRTPSQKPCGPARQKRGRFHRTAVMQLQQRYLTTQAKLDRAYDERLDLH